MKLTVSGRVQGVGFRWFIKQKANELGLTGYVRNLSAGEVEVEVEGNEETVDDLIRYAQAGPSFSRVSHVNIKKKKFSGLYKSFQITF